MKYHPSAYMAGTWAFAVALLLILPLQITGRPMSFYGFAVLALFIGVFIVGSLIGGAPTAQLSRTPNIVLDLSRADRIFKGAAIVSLVAFMIEFSRRDFFDFGASYVERDSRLVDLINAAASQSSLAFQIGFFFYPVAIAYLARMIIYEERIKIFPMILYGLAPTLAASLALGGRSPLLYALGIVALTLTARRLFFGVEAVNRPRRARPLLYALGAVVAVLSMNYFVQVFIARADVTGGIDAAFDNAAFAWGVTLSPDWYAFLVNTIGTANTYLLFVFSWYTVQGVIIANQIFSEYSGTFAFGAYGIDIGGALIRRIAPEYLSGRFLELLDLNVYGFLPTAFGSIYVDIGWLGMIVIAGWGYVCGLVYRNIRKAVDPRWLIYAPFVIFGIIFSLLNTPLGFANGLLVYFWLIFAMRFARIYQLVEDDGPYTILSRIA